MALQKAKFPIQQYVWLVFGGACLFGALVFWAVTDTKELIEVDKQPETEVELQIQPEKVAAMNHLGALYDEVKPLDMTTRVVVTAQHEAEFRGTKFITEHKNDVAVEIFRSSNEEIVKSFLRKQSDRKPFIYLRLSGEDHPEQYVLLYGVYRSNSEANQAIADMKMNLPASVKPVVVAIDQYQPLVNDLGTEELKNNSKIYSVKLKTAPLPQVDEAQLAAARLKAQAQQAETQVDSAKNVTTTTTVTRRDASGNVVNVQKSQSSAEPTRPKTTPINSVEHEVSDPFN